MGLSLGSKAQEIVQNINQVLDVPRWRSIAIAATELFKLFNDTLFEHYRGNPTVIMWQWQCKLSLRSCVCCIALHNTLHELTETLDDHVNGECSPLPYFAGQELGQSGIDWFAEQSEETQRAIMGTQVAYDLWKSGKATLQDFIGVRHDAEYGSSVYQQSAKRIMKGK